ncbi:hypothetical protein [Peribacillus saganii]|uniref:hypothetical protein n=1 Tax=Peribacillus saganii TaxID=2303992 RepID=UPI0026938EA4|nr:hypothetical protein [Peribacillus saganii]
MNGSGGVLFEVKGQTQNYGQKMKGQLVRTVKTGVMGIYNSVADRSVYESNPRITMKFQTGSIFDNQDKEADAFGGNQLLPYCHLWVLPQQLL